jgi:hypothetical protein
MTAAELADLASEPKTEYICKGLKLEQLSKLQLILLHVLPLQHRFTQGSGHSTLPDGKVSRTNPDELTAALSNCAG